MEILLVEVRGINHLHLHNGLASLGGALKDRWTCKIVDLNYLAWSNDQLRDYIIKINPRVLGFSVQSVNAPVVAEFIASLKDRVTSLIVVGGPYVSLKGLEYLQDNPAIDYGLRFEAEESLPDFLDHLAGHKTIKEIPGLIYRANGNCLVNSYNFPSDLDRLGFPDFDCFEGVNAREYFQHHSYPLLTSRGCPYNCIYCSVKVLSGKFWRYRSINNIIAELSQAKEKYGINSFEIIDDNFTLDLDRAREFCQALTIADIRLPWSCPDGIRADRVNKELAQVMYQAGCQHVSLGIESGTQKVFDQIKKGERLQDVVEAAKMLMQSGIKVTGFFIVGLPGDNIKETRETVRFIRQLNLNGGIKWNFLIPYPQTELWDWIGTNGVFLHDFTRGWHYSKTGDKLIPIFETPDFSARDRLRAWKIANLSTGVYHCVFRIPSNRILFLAKAVFYLLIYTPDVLCYKIYMKLKKLFKFNTD